MSAVTWQYLTAMQPPPDYLDEEELDADLGTCVHALVWVGMCE